MHGPRREMRVSRVWARVTDSRARLQGYACFLTHGCCAPWSSTPLHLNVKTEQENKSRYVPNREKVHWSTERSTRATLANCSASFRTRFGVIEGLPWHLEVGGAPHMENATEGGPWSSPEFLDTGFRRTGGNSLYLYRFIMRFCIIIRQLLQTYQAPLMDRASTTHIISIVIKNALGSRERQIWTHETRYSVLSIRCSDILFFHLCLQLSHAQVERSLLTHYDKFNFRDSFGRQETEPQWRSGSL